MSLLKKFCLSLVILATALAGVPFNSEFLSNYAQAAAVTQTNQPGQNFLRQSQDLTTIWSTTNLTVVKNIALSPAGTFTANRVTDTVTNATHSFSQASVPTVSGRVYTISAYFKYENHPLILIGANGGDATAYVYVNTQTGTIASTVGANQLASGIISVGNGWYRAWNTFTANSNASQPTFYFAQSVGTLSYAGSSTDTMQVWGVQEVLGTKPVAYNRTGATAFNSTFVPTGVTQSNQLGQNMIRFSEQFDNGVWGKINSAVVATNTAMAPDGTMTAESVTSSNANAYIQNTAAASKDATAYTGSVWLRADSPASTRIEITDVGDGVPATAKIVSLTTSWQRFSVTGSGVAGMGTGTATFMIGNRTGGFPTTSTIYLWGAQVVQGKSPAAYNKTVATAFNSTFVATGATKSKQLGQNLLKFSEQFDDASWTKSLATITPNTASTTDPIGGYTADILVEDGSNNLHRTTQLPGTYVLGQTYTFSAYLKASTRTWAALQGDSGGTGINYFDLTNGVVGTLSGATASIKRAGNGWWRASITYPAGTGGSVYIYPAAANNGFIYQGTSSTSIYMWGVQLVRGSNPAAYNRTTSAAFNSTYQP